MSKNIFCRIFESANRQILCEKETDKAGTTFITISTFGKEGRVYTHIPCFSPDHATQFLKELDSESALDYLGILIETTGTQKVLEHCFYCGAFKEIGKPCPECD